LRANACFLSEILLFDEAGLEPEEQDGVSVSFPDRRVDSIHLPILSNMKYALMHISVHNKQRNLRERIINIHVSDGDVQAFSGVFITIP